MTAPRTMPPAADMYRPAAAPGPLRWSAARGRIGRRRAGNRTAGMADTSPGPDTARPGRAGGSTRRVTIRDVADRAGVSVATVSRVLAGNYPTSAAARAKVLR